MTYSIDLRLKMLQVYSEKNYLLKKYVKIFKFLKKHSLIGDKNIKIYVSLKKQIKMNYRILRILPVRKSLIVNCLLMELKNI